MLDDRTRIEFPASGDTSLPLIFQPQVVRVTAAGPGGRPLQVLVDTGTDPSVIDLRLARQLGLRLGDFALGHDAASDRVPFTETVLPWLRLGDLTLRDVYLLAVDLGDAPFPVDLVLGYNVLPFLIMTIDYQRGALRFGHPDLGPPACSPRGATLPLTFIEHFPALNGLCLAGGMELPPTTIDTGSNGELTLGPDLAARAGLYAGAAHVSLGEGRGFSSRCSVLRASSAIMRLGPFALRDVELDTPGPGQGELQRGDRANIGNRLLARFARVTLDYGRSLCLIEP